MEINEIIGGIISAIFMLPIALIISFIIKNIVTPLKAAKIISFVASMVYLVLGPSTISLAVKQGLVELKPYYHGYPFYFVTYLLLGCISVYYAVNFTYKSSNK